MNAESAGPIPQSTESVRCDPPISVCLFVDWQGLLGPSVACSHSDEHHSNNENHREWRRVDRTPQHPESGTDGHCYANNEHDSAS